MTTSPTNRSSLADDDGLEPWERCGCAACQATMAVLYGDPCDGPDYAWESWNHYAESLASDQERPS